MLKHLLILGFLFLGINSVSIANDFKLDQGSIETKFDISVEVPIEHFTYFAAIKDGVTSRVIDQNIAGVLAICCGTFGAHRFYMGQMDAGLKHLAVTVLVGAFGAASLIALGTTSPTGTTTTSNIITGFSMVTYGLAYCGSFAHGVYTLVEGIMYLVMPEAKFQGKIVKDPAFFAAFKRD